MAIKLTIGPLLSPSTIKKLSVCTFSAVAKYQVVERLNLGGTTSGIKLAALAPSTATIIFSAA
ncbi:unannotated protein [freshwater metagenome]|uniref:Unannotated protein n=1 Tax=freshwater metagenome TaxID=449393 RepID=A0A6J6PCI2_9ZZZZ